MEEDRKKIQNLQNLDIQYLKAEKESLIKSNYAYSDKISRMEVEISDLKAMLQAVQNENKELNARAVKAKENSLNSELIDKLQKEIKQLTEKGGNSGKDSSEKLEFDDLNEEVNELREEIQYLKGEYVPKLENQLENARLLINELENEVICLNNENKGFKKSIQEIGSANEKRNSQNKEFLQPSSPTEYLKEEKMIYRGQNAKQKTPGYMPSIKRIEKNAKTPEFAIQLGKNY